MKIKLAVLFGGKSVEHEISVISALQAMNSLDAEKYEIIPVYITKTNEFYTGEVLRDINAYRDTAKLLSQATRVTFVSENGRTRLDRLPAKRFGSSEVAGIDVAFPIVHGTNVEDGSLQGFLKTLNLPFVGCDVLASAVGMDKFVMKTVLQEAGFPVLPALRFTSRDFNRPDEVIGRIEKAFGYPVIVKPVNLGSSVGISRANDRAELENALDTAFSFAETVLTERAVVSLREINCSVLGDETGAEPTPSVLEEPLMHDAILSYKDKYMDGGKGSKSSGMASLKRKIPAELDEARAEEIRKLAVGVFRALGCSGVVRIDFLLDTAEDRVYVNEINTIPGSLSFYLWEPKGMKYSALLDRLVEYALARARRQNAVTYTFDTNVFAMGSGFGGAKGAKGAKGTGSAS